MTPRRTLAAALVVALPLLLTACDFEQVIDLEVPPYEPSLVIGGFPTPDSVFTVRVGRSASALAPTDSNPFGLFISDARVALFDGDGAFLDSLEYVEPSGPGVPGGLHRSVRGVRPEPGRAYTLRAEAPGLPPVEATTRLPEPVPLDARVVRVNEPTEYGEQSVRLAVAVADAPGPQTYALTVRSESGPYPQPLPFRSSAPSLRESFDRLDVAVDIDIDTDPGPRHFYGRAIFRDGLFDGTRHEIELDVTYFEHEPGEPPPLSVTLSTLSDDYVRYQQTLELQDETGDNPFAEPVRIHSNAEGGMGVFAGYTSSAVALEIE